MGVVLSWNVQGRVRSVPEQAAAVAQRRADVVALQEIRVNALPAWQELLAARGYEHQAASLTDTGRRAPERRLGVLVASRAPLQPLPPVSQLPWPERHQAVRTSLDGEPVEIHDLHAPISQKAGQVKVLTLETMFGVLAPPSDVPRVLVGDLNTPRYETREGEVQTFARTRTGRLRPDYGERHDNAELALLVGLQAHGTSTPSGRCTASSAVTAAGCTRTARPATGSTTPSCAACA